MSQKSGMMRKLSFSRSRKNSHSNAAPVIDAEGGQFEGWFSKRSMGKQSAFKNWRTRWIVLNPEGVISWHKNPGEQAAGSLQLGAGSTVVFDDPHTNRLRITSGSQELLLSGSEADVATLSRATQHALLKRGSQQQSPSARSQRARAPISVGWSRF